MPSVADQADFVLTRSGRSAIVLALRAIGIGPGDRVLVPNYYCPTMIAPVEYVGAQPVFYPVTQAREPDLDWLASMKFEGRSAMLAAHFFGLPIPLSAVRSFCDTRGMALIEDCAHAFFGEAAGVPVGISGDFAIASLPKFFPVLEGGLLVCRVTTAPLKRLARPGAMAEIKALWNITEAAAAYRKIPLLSAAVARISRARSAATEVLQAGEQVPVVSERPSPEAVRAEALADPLLAPARLRSVERWIIEHCNRQRLVENRRRNYARLAAQLSAAAGCRVLFPRIHGGAVPYALPLHVDDAERVYPHLRAAGLPVYRWDRYWPGAQEVEDGAGLDWGRHVIQISCHQDLTLEHVDAMANRIETALR